MGKATNKAVIAALSLPLLLSACASTQSASLPPAPAMDSLSDAPMVTKAPTIKRADPVAAIQALTKGDDIEIEAPVPVLSAVMPKESPKDDKASE